MAPQPSTIEKVMIRNDKTGEEKPVSAQVWKDMGNSKNNGDQRRGYTRIGMATVDKKNGKVLEVKPTAPSGGRKPATFQPPWLNEDGTVKEGAPSAQAQPQGEASEPAKPAATASPAKPSETQPAAPVSKADNLVTMPGMGSKVAEAMAKAGLGTYAAIAAADPQAIEAVLKGMVPSMEPKKAQIPAWQKWAKDNPKKPAE